MAKYIMGIDSGLTNSKTVLFDLDGKELASASRSFEVSSPKPGWVQADPNKLWANTADCIRETIDKAGIDSKDIGAIGSTGFGNGVFFIKSDGSPAYPACGSNDNRAAEEEIELNNSPVAAKITAINSTLVGAWQPLTIARWLKKNEPEAYANVDWLCQCKDYLNFRLTGTKCAERNDVSGAGYLDTKTGEVSKELFELFGVEEMFDKIAPLAEFSHSIVGYVSEETAQRTGLTAGTPVGAGLMDVAACAVAVGVVEKGTACAIVGTWSINEVIDDKLLPEMRSAQFFATPGKYLSLSGGATSATNLEWFINEFGQGCKVEAEARGVSRYDVVSEKADLLPPGGTSVLYLPYIGSPNVHPYGRASFSNITYGHTFNDLARALFEGITFDHKYHLDHIKKMGGSFTKVRLAGGGARSAFWSQMFADVLECPVEVVSVAELGALGTAVAAAIGAGLYKSYDEALARTVALKATFEPIPENSKAYLNRYKSWYATVEGFVDMWNDGKIEG